MVNLNNVNNFDLPKGRVGKLLIIAIATLPLQKTIIMMWSPPLFFGESIHIQMPFFSAGLKPRAQNWSRHPHLAPMWSWMVALGWSAHVCQIWATSRPQHGHMSGPDPANLNKNSLWQRFGEALVHSIRSFYVTVVCCPCGSDLASRSGLHPSAQFQMNVSGEGLIWAATILLSWKFSRRVYSLDLGKFKKEKKKTQWKKKVTVRHRLWLWMLWHDSWFIFSD